MQTAQLTWPTPWQTAAFRLPRLHFARTQPATRLRQSQRRGLDFFVGAGTVVTAQQVAQTKAAGAQFALAPGTDPAMIEAAQAAGLPYAPGIMTPSDLQIATRLGCRFLKFFPAGLAGGPKMLANIAAPFAHLGLSFNPTGGINPSNMGDWLTEPNVRAVGGTWIATRQDIADGNWDAITQNARVAVARVKATRESQNV